MGNIIVGWLKSALTELLDDQEFKTAVVGFLNDPHVTAWVDGRINGAITTGENVVVAKIEGLPGDIEKALGPVIGGLLAGIVGGGVSDINTLLHEVTGTKTDIAQATQSLVRPLFDAESVASAIWANLEGMIHLPFEREDPPKPEQRGKRGRR